MTRANLRRGIRRRAQSLACVGTQSYVPADVGDLPWLVAEGLGVERGEWEVAEEHLTCE